MGNLRSSTDKRRKAYYYIVNIFNILIPNFFFRKRLESILNKKNYSSEKVATNLAYDLLKQEEEAKRLNERWWRNLKQLE